ncbi:hypothetical protein R1flu_021640 [Riccia fluitans]|uniref:Uncharacterized protein n=1 Tax=Riccia fluitans TaxID=41844 RepID=A0ABD1ZR55_9MARC
MVDFNRQYTCNKRTTARQTPDIMTMTGASKGMRQKRNVQEWTAGPGPMDHRVATEWEPSRTRGTRTTGTTKWERRLGRLRADGSIGSHQSRAGRKNEDAPRPSTMTKDSMSATPGRGQKSCEMPIKWKRQKTRLRQIDRR